MSVVITKTQAKNLWIEAQGLNQKAPFGLGAKATTKAIKHLGYVQIDTISVIERCHHHILYSRIPNYKAEHLHAAQTKEKTVFEYWTHALAYIPTRDFKFFLPIMKKTIAEPNRWFQSVQKEEMKKVLTLIKKNGAISIRDIQDDVLVEKEHEWASRKPSKKALQYGFHCGQLVISERIGMLKKYELVDRHFDWDQKPKAATEKECNAYLLDRALKS
ncbi:MAG: winged helix DNA-binding domain-containing protein, partial [Bdellovibrio sp.]|nr:winged helix DNA-binding domain-containing protein [Bdellovibrio sp.]